MIGYFVSNMISNVTYLTRLDTYRDKEQHGTANFILSKEFRVVVFGVTITVPAGFATDFNSVPRLFRWMVSRTDGVEGAVVHDYLYNTPDIYSRGWADDVLNEMDKDQINPIIRVVKNTGVRVGGWKRWNEVRKER